MPRCCGVCCGDEFWGCPPHLKSPLLTTYNGTHHGTNGGCCSPPCLQLQPLWIIPAAAVSRHVPVHLQAAAFERLCAEAEAAAAVGAAAAGSEEHLAVDETAILLHPLYL